MLPSLAASSQCFRLVKIAQSESESEAENHYMFITFSLHCNYMFIFSAQLIVQEEQG